MFKINGQIEIQAALLFAVARALVRGALWSGRRGALVDVKKAPVGAWLVDCLHRSKNEQISSRNHQTAASS